MKTNTFLLALLFASAALLVGCLQEKTLDQAQLNTLPQATSTPMPTTSQIQPTPTAAQSQPTATPIATATPAATTSGPASCSIIAAGGGTYRSPASVETLISFKNILPSVTTAMIKCYASDLGINVAISRLTDGSMIARPTCNYSPGSPSSYVITASAGGATCSATVFVTTS